MAETGGSNARRPNVNRLLSMFGAVWWPSIQYTNDGGTRIPLLARLLSSKIRVDGRHVLLFCFFSVDEKQLVCDKRETAIKSHGANLGRRRHKRRNGTERGRIHNDIFFEQLKIVK